MKEKKFATTLCGNHDMHVTAVSVVRLKKKKAPTLNENSDMSHVMRKLAFAYA